MSEVNIELSTKLFNKKYIRYLDDETRYLCVYGGASSGKSYFIGQRCIYRLLHKKMNLLVVRQTGDSNRNSTFALLKQIINEWGLANEFKITDLKIVCKNGNEVIFKGLDDVEKIKSITFSNGILTDIWIEEATECSEEDVNQLMLRLRGGRNIKKQMVLSFNPVNANHWIKRKFIDTGLAKVLHTTYKDNKFLSEEDKKTLESFKEKDPYYYEVYCLGLWGVIGKTYFNARKINERIQRLKEPIQRGYFYYEFNENTQKIRSFRFINDPNGCIKIYKDVDPRTPYVIGGDTAGEGSDYFTAHIINNLTGEQVAVLRQECDEIEYTRQIWCLGMYFNKALIGLEANFSTYPIAKLDEMKYPHQFVREKEDDYTNKLERRLGFKTTSVTRPLILAMLQTLVLEQTDKINDKDTLEEMLVFVRNEKGRPEAQNGAHDDLVMGLAIANYCRQQQRYTPLERPMIKANSQTRLDDFLNLSIDKHEYGGYGEKIQII